MEREFSGRSPFLSGPLLIPLGAGEKFDTGRLGTQWKIDGPQTGGRFSVVHHQLPPRTLAAPLHRHHREDEHSYVLTGTFGALLGDDVVTADELPSRVDRHAARDEQEPARADGVRVVAERLRLPRGADLLAHYIRLRR